MISSKIAAITAGVLLAAVVVMRVRQGGAQPETISTYEPERMKDFKKPEPAQLKEKLSSEQFAVTQQCGTEPPFHNAYWDLSLIHIWFFSKARRTTSYRRTSICTFFDGASMGWPGNSPVSI